MLTDPMGNHKSNAKQPTLQKEEKRPDGVASVPRACPVTESTELKICI